uniref:Procollagen-proline 3-dioxygenase n=1 Tax=Panagrellus redivivus TaxID=6233 RepID=A0A7E4VUB4_PANRE
MDLQLVFLLLLLHVTVPDFSAATPEQPQLTFQQLYKYGKNEYTAKNWNDCVGFMLRAIEDYTYYKEETLWCREMCDRQTNEVPADIVKLDSPKLIRTGMFYGTAQKALCLLRCRIDKFTEERPTMSNYDTYEEFQDRKPYHYLQFCYWKQNDLKNAVKAAFTYLVANPTDEDTVVNLQFYMTQPGYDASFLVDSLQMEYERHYMSAVEAYENQDWERCVERFDLALDAYFKEEHKCKMLCEDYLDWGTMQGDNPEMSIVITSIYTSVIRCQNNCITKLSKVNGHTIKNFLASFYEYLHVCQFNLQRGRDAAQSVANALLLDKDNVVMRRNRLFYASLYENQVEDLFQPSEKIAQHYKQDVIEKRFIAFVDSRFKYEDRRLPAEVAEDRHTFNVEVDIRDDFDYSRIMDNILTEKECTALKVASQLPAQANRYIDNLIDEVSTRINTLYGSTVVFQKLNCHQEMLKSGCDRGAFVIGIDSERCSAILADEYSGCALVYCV